MQYNTIQYKTTQYNTIQYNTIQYYTIQYNTIQYSTIQYNTIKYNTIQHNTQSSAVNDSMQHHQNNNTVDHYLIFAKSSTEKCDGVASMTSAKDPLKGPRARKK